MASDKARDRIIDPKARALPPARTWTILGLILVGSTLLGIACVFQSKSSPFFNLPIIDEESYVNWGKSIAEGAIMGEHIFYQDPLYPYLLGLIFSVFGKSYMAVRIVQVFMGTGAVALVFFIARPFMGEKPALLASAIMASYRGLYFFELLLLKATAVVFFSALSCAIGVWAASSEKARSRWLAAGASLGLLALLRGNFQAIMPFMALLPLVVFRGRPLKTRLMPASFMVIGILAVVVPVSVRNYAVGGELVLTTSQGGANFFIGNNQQANGRYVDLPFVRANPRWESRDFEAEAEKRAGRELSPSEVSRFWFRQAFSWIRDHPGKAFKLMVLKARLMAHQHEIPDNHSFYLTRELFAEALWVPVLGFGLLWGPALAGILIIARKEPKAVYPAAFAMLYALSIIPFFIVARYRLAVLPSISVFAAAFLVWAWKRWNERDTKALLPAGAAILASLLIGFLPTPVSRAPMGMEYYLLGNAYLKTGKPRKAIPWYDKARETLPRNPEVAKNRAIAMSRLNTSEISSLVSRVGKGELGPDELVEAGKRLEQLGQVKTAIKIYEGAAKKNPDMFTPRARLGFLYSTHPEVKDTDKAVSHLEQALRIRPGDLDTMNALGNVHFLAGNTEEAKKWWERILEKDPGFDAAGQNLRVLEQSNQ